MEKNLIRIHWDLDVFKLAFEAALQIFDKSRSFPIKEGSSLNDQVRQYSWKDCEFD